MRAFERELLRDTRKAGTTVASIEMPRFYAYTLPVPGLSEQRRIVEILEDHLSRLDAAADYASAADRRLAALRAASFEAVWKAGHPEAQLASIGRIMTGSTPGGDAASGDLWFVTPGDLEVGRSLETAARRVPRDAEARARVTAGPATLVVCIGATLGKVGSAQEPVAFNQQINALEPALEHAITEFVTMALAAPSGQRMLHDASSSTTMPILNKGRFSKLQIPLPALAVQRRLVEDASTALIEADRLQAAVGAAKRRADSMRRALLAAAFSGKLSGRRTDVEVIEEFAGAMA